jgi:hypothetical protein
LASFLFGLHLGGLRGVVHPGLAIAPNPAMMIRKSYQERIILSHGQAGDEAGEAYEV